jgi:hypothetical protein
MSLKKILMGLLVVDVIGVNVVAGYSLVKWLTFETEPYKTAFQITTQAEVKENTSGGCGAECKASIATEVAKQLGEGTPQEPTGTIVPKPTVKSVTALAKAKTRREEVLTIPGNGSSAVSMWSDVGGTEFYFDTRDYPGLVEVYFEANIRLINGNGTGYVRLYDITNSIAPTGGENNTSSQADVWTKSQKVYLWAGRNLMRVQARTLTADTVVYNQGRLRIVTEN